MAKHGVEEPGEEESRRVERGAAKSKGMLQEAWNELSVRVLNAKGWPARTLASTEFQRT